MPSIPFTIREAHASDLDEMVELLRQLFAIEDDFVFDAQRQRHGIAALIADHNRCTALVAVVNGVVVGMCTAQMTVSTAEGGASALVEDLIVAESVRRNGIGTALFAAIRNWATDRGCVRMQLLADQRNQAALKFHADRGWWISNMICLNYTTMQQGRRGHAGGMSVHIAKGENHAS
jgi:GNAT superfamily N-acetyltransferase